MNFFALLDMTQLVCRHARALERHHREYRVDRGKMVLPWSRCTAHQIRVGALTEGLRMELRREGIHAMWSAPVT